MASMGAQVDVPRGRGPYCYRIHGQVYHRIGTLHPNQGEPRQFGQIYILDTEQAAQERLGNVQNVNCDSSLMFFLSEWYAHNNIYAQSFKMMNEIERAEDEVARRENRPPVAIRMIFEENRERRVARGQYAMPTSNEVAVIYVGEENDVPPARSLAVHLRESEGTSLINISDIDKRCDLLTYPLLFPTGRGGWDPSLVDASGERITQMKYYSYLFSIRDTFNPILHARKLFQQFAVDVYVKIEQNRLNYHRTHQVNLRSESYRGLIDYLAGQEQQSIDRARTNFTTLTAYFQLNQICADVFDGGAPSDMVVDAREFYYHQIPEHFTFTPRHGWKPRRRGGKEIGRMYTVSPRDVERYCLRILLLNTKGKTSFEDLRTVEGIVYETFSDAAKASGFLDDDTYYRQSIEEAAQFQTPSTLRGFFACLLCYCEVVDATELWNEFARAMADDYLHRGLGEAEAIAVAYFDIADRMQLLGRDLAQTIVPPVNQRPSIPDVPINYEHHEVEEARLYETLNTNQRKRNTADDILAAPDRDDQKCFFIDGPGGTGKTYLYTTIYNVAIGQRRKVLCVAWTGIAANLLPGGRTVNSAFKLNMGDGNRSSVMKRQQREARQLAATDIIIWDEISMAPKCALEAVDALLRDTSLIVRLTPDSQASFRARFARIFPMSTDKINAGG
ncbi:hypothetical protein Aduo_013503 [Ancylostoma duodenale]